MSWAGYERALPPEMIPHRLFDRLFGAREEGWVNRKRSILDTVTADAKALECNLPADDKTRIDEHLSGIRDLERAIAGLPAEYAHVDPPDFDGDMKDAAAKKAAGVTAYKIKVGVETPQKDAARTRAICQALGGGLLISADANQGYTVAQAIDYVRALQGCGLDFFEQPVMAHDLAGMAEVAAAAGAIAIGADEGIHSRDDISRHHEMMAARGVSLKAIKLGGLRALTEAGRLCDRLGMSVNVSCKTGESSIACAAALHAAAVMPNIAWALTLTHTGLAADVTAQPIPTARGHVESLERPGLGVDVDEDLVRVHRVEVTAREFA